MTLDQWTQKPAPKADGKDGLLNWGSCRHFTTCHVNWMASMLKCHDAAMIIAK